MTSKTTAKDVNAHDKMLEVCRVLAAYSIETCRHCQGDGWQDDGRGGDLCDACHTCGGTGETCPNMPLAQDIRTARKAVALAEKVRLRSPKPDGHARKS